MVKYALESSDSDSDITWPRSAGSRGHNHNDSNINVSHHSDTNDNDSGISDMNMQDNEGDTNDTNIPELNDIDSDSESDGYDADDNGVEADEDLADDMDEDLELLYLAAKHDLDELLGSRYWAERNYRPPDNTIFEKHLDEGTFVQTDADGKREFFRSKEFKKHYRCSRDALDWLVDQIKDHPVFHKNEEGRRGRKQTPVKYQLMVLLYYLGHESVTNADERAIYWRSEGLYEECRNRCVLAIRSLKDKYVDWPGEEERKEIAKRILVKYQIPNAVGTIDGTLLEVAIMPEADDAGDYSGRKYQWSVSVLLINDDKTKIRYFHAGFPGSAHDNRIWKRTKIFLKKEEFFSTIEYLLGDTAFEPSDIMVPAFKKQVDVPQPLDQSSFNTKMAKPRVRSEHTVGVWKGRWPFLRKIRKIITNEKQSLIDIMEHIECCVILHNMLLEYGDISPEKWCDGESDIDDPTRAPDDDDPLNQPLPDGAPKDARREQVKGWLEDNYVYGGRDNT
jgi:hypothetical protein